MKPKAVSQILGTFWWFLFLWHRFTDDKKLFFGQKLASAGFQFSNGKSPKNFIKNLLSPKVFTLALSRWGPIDFAFQILLSLVNEYWGFNFGLVIHHYFFAFYLYGACGWVNDDEKCSSIFFIFKYYKIGFKLTIQKFLKYQQLFMNLIVCFEVGRGWTRLMKLPHIGEF